MSKPLSFDVDVVAQAIFARMSSIAPPTVFGSSASHGRKSDPRQSFSARSPDFPLPRVSRLGSARRASWVAPAAPRHLVGALSRQTGHKGDSGHMGNTRIHGCRSLAGGSAAGANPTREELSGRLPRYGKSGRVRGRGMSANSISISRRSRRRGYFTRTVLGGPAVEPR